MFSFAGLGAVESLSIIVPIKPYVDRGQVHTPFIYVCVSCRASSGFLCF